MSKRSSKKPLEWQFGFVNAADATVTNYRIELGLKDDEVAEIHKIDSMVDIANIPDAANDDIAAYSMLSMDPDVDADPALAASHDDLEIFFEHQENMQQEIGAAGQSALNRGPSHKVSDFEEPVLVGTDVGMVVHGDADVAVNFWVRLYFTRRKANVMELNQILLKRR